MDDQATVGALREVDVSGPGAVYERFSGHRERNERRIWKNFLLDLLEELVGEGVRTLRGAGLVGRAHHACEVAPERCLQVHMHWQGHGGQR